MITEDYVSFAISKLLKEKGFDENCAALYDLRNGEFCEKQTGCVFNNSQWENFITAPTYQMVMKWLREIHKLFITIDWTGYENEYIWSIQDMNSGMCWESDEIYILYEHACEAAILFCLGNLI